jgi:2,5-diamino-6-(ribosylamino)-4(3H)-pyrimidinone 5'-phosphate reductase
MQNEIKNRPITTLFMLESLDGKISTGSTDNLDVDKDFPRIDGVKQGLHQYYELEQETDLFSLNTGRVMAKIGVNNRSEYPEKMDQVTFVIIDNKPHLNENGIDYLCHWVGKLLLVTTNKDHPAYNITNKYSNLEILYYEALDLTQLMEDLYSKYNAERLTIQSGGTLNGLFVRNKLIDFVNIVVAPILIGGKDVATLVDGESIKDESELNKLMPLQLIECNQLEDSYVQLKYKVL